MHLGGSSHLFVNLSFFSLLVLHLQIKGLFFSPHPRHHHTHRHHHCIHSSSLCSRRIQSVRDGVHTIDTLHIPPIETVGVLQIAAKFRFLPRGASPCNRSDGSVGRVMVNVSRKVEGTVTRRHVIDINIVTVHFILKLVAHKRLQCGCIVVHIRYANRHLGQVLADGPSIICGTWRF